MTQDDGTKRDDVQLRRKYSEMFASALSLVRCKALAVEGGFRLGVEVDGDLSAWLCAHTHETICEAERCGEARAERLRNGPMSDDFVCSP